MDPKIAAWVAHLEQIGVANLPDPPAVGGLPVTITATTAKAGAQPAQPYISGVTFPRPDGAVMIEAIEDEIASNPDWANAPHWYFHPDVVTIFGPQIPQFMIDNNNGNAVNAWQEIGQPPLAKDIAADARLLGSAYLFSEMHPGLRRGVQLTDAVSFPANIGQFKTVAIADIATFITNCNTADKTGEKHIPLINHQTAPGQ